MRLCKNVKPSASPIAAVREMCEISGNSTMCDRSILDFSNESSKVDVLIEHLTPRLDAQP